MYGNQPVRIQFLYLVATNQPSSGNFHQVCYYFFGVKQEEKETPAWAQELAWMGACPERFYFRSWQVTAGTTKRRYTPTNDDSRLPPFRWSLVMVPKPNETGKPVWRILTRHGQTYLVPRSTKMDGPGYMSGRKGIQKFEEIVKTAPGSGKSRDASEFVNEAWEKASRKGLYLMLSHSAIEERLEKLREYGKDKNWAHWRPHDGTCERQLMNSKGYIGQGRCTCGRGQLKAEGPTLAPIEYILPSTPTSDGPLVNVVNEFDFWVIDEMDFRRLLGLECASLEDVHTTAMTHPNETVKALCSAIEELMRNQKQGHLNGNDLYESLASIFALRDLGTFPPKEPDGSLQAKLSHFERHGELPRNFPPILVPVLLSEARAWARGESIIPRVHLVRTGQNRELRVWWRKDLELSEWGFSPRPFFILDATADANLLSDVFLSPGVEEMDAPGWPGNVHVHQWFDNLVSRSTLGLPVGASPNSPKSRKARQRWYGRIADALDSFPRDWPIGIITHLTIENEAREAIDDMGFADVQSLHYGDERGRNTLEDVKLLVLLGLPIPNLDAFKEEAQAFLYDRGALDFTWEDQEQHFEMLDGSQESQTVGGYWTEPVASYYRQKCRFGLYQAVHRIRPYLVDPGDERHVFIFTNMPIPSVKVEEFIRSPDAVRIKSRFEMAVKELESKLESHGVSKVPGLASVIAAQEGQSAGTIRHWISDNSERLAQATSSTFYPGMTGRPGRFERPRNGI